MHIYHWMRFEQGDKSNQAEPIVRRHLPCAYLGAAIPGAFRDCKTCGGNVRLKVFGCGHPGHAARPTTTETECRACGDYAIERAKVAKP